ncbi:MAG: DUF2461 domain-containing protein [Anaerolineaceae bacterium]|jgi:uncharacterized protein (TIGR02453 family)|nr:DUF2461 domain-containing protein [Anaerolineaceae bacterium]
MPQHFTGFPLGTRDFYKDLAANNNKAWFTEHKPFYTQAILPAARALVSDLGARLCEIAPGVVIDTGLNGSGSIFRIHRDIRFSPDKSPYKTYLGILWWQGSRKKNENSGFYFQLEHNRLNLYTGVQLFPRDALDEYRQSVQDGKYGAALNEIIAQLQSSGYLIGGDQYKRLPAGYSGAQDNAELLLYKGLYAGMEGPIPDEFYAIDLVDICFEHFRNMAPLHHWLHQMLESSPPA